MLENKQKGFCPPCKKDREGLCPSCKNTGGIMSACTKMSRGIFPGGILSAALKTKMGNNQNYP